MTSLYRQILKKAWYIARKFRVLWLLGIFAAFLGNGSEYQVLFQQVGKVQSQADTVKVWAENLNSLMPKLDFAANKVILASLTLAIGLAIFLLFLWLAISSLGGLIKGAALANNDEKASFGSLIKAGSAHFWPLLGLNIVAKAIVYGILILILTPLMVVTFAQSSLSANLFIILLTFLIFLPITIIVALVTKYASAFVILNGEKFRSAFKNGWRLFSANWLVSLEMALIIFVINLAVGLIFVLLSLLLFSPFFFFGVVYTINAPSLFNVLMYISLTLLLLASLAIGAVLSAFQITSWTLLYLKLSSGTKVYSKLVRMVATWPAMFKKKKT